MFASLGSAGIIGAIILIIAGHGETKAPAIVARVIRSTGISVVAYSTGRLVRTGPFHAAINGADIAIVALLIGGTIQGGRRHKRIRFTSTFRRSHHIGITRIGTHNIRAIADGRILPVSNSSAFRIHILIGIKGEPILGFISASPDSHRHYQQHQHPRISQDSDSFVAPPQREVVYRVAPWIFNLDFNRKKLYLKTLTMGH